MMRLWLESYARPADTAPGAVIGVASIAVHVLLIAAAVLGTAPSPDAAAANEYALANRPFYIPPPNRMPEQGGTRETIRYITLSPVGLGAGLGPGTMDVRRPIGLEETRARGDVFRDTSTAPAIAPTTGRDTVFTILEVDSVAVVDANSAAPAYPAELLSKGVTGSVRARYVVDTTGYADTATFLVISATDPGFVGAVRAALPNMRFSPAKIGHKKVAQLVEQEFTFRIALPAPKDTVAQRN